MDETVEQQFDNPTNMHESHKDIDNNVRRNPTSDARRPWTGDDNNAFPPEMSDDTFGQYKEYVNHLSVKNAEKIDPDATREAIVKEISSLMSQGTFEFMDQKRLTTKERLSIIPSMLFMKQKSTGVMKARVVGGGHMQIPKPYQETTSPTVSTDSLFACLAIATERNMEVSTGDVETAFLKADNYDDQLMRIGPRESQYFIKAFPLLKKHLDHRGTLVVRIKKALYGLVQSARLWYLHLASSLKGLGYTATLEDKCVFSKNVKGELSFILIHVDDLFFIKS